MQVKQQQQQKQSKNDNNHKEQQHTKCRMSVQKHSRYMQNVVTKTNTLHADSQYKNIHATC